MRNIRYAFSGRPSTQFVKINNSDQDQCVYSLEMALSAPAIPPEILQNLLNLAEFMEHDDKRLPINIKVYIITC